MHAETSPDLPIPDAQPAGIASQIVVGSTSVIAAISVRVEIEHTFKGDLRVNLVSPGGEIIALHQGIGGGEDNLFQTYTVDEIPDFNRLVGTPANGSWTLRVADLVGQDVGRLKRWAPPSPPMGLFV